MKKPDSEVLFQCRMASTGFLWLAAVLAVIYFSIAAVVIALFHGAWFAVLLYGGAMGGFGVFLLIHFIRQASSILTITADTLCLTRFGKCLIEFRRDEITSSGRFIAFNNKEFYLYFAAETAGTQQGTLYRRIKKTANKRGSAYLCIGETAKRLEALQAIFPNLSVKNEVSYAYPNGRKVQ